ncbi:MAG TPA: AraC family transcriptional regulator ligand-binding domain-containing protein, partial [Xanthomonadales bacterium]|nr:AraC family transcriptional regulator ligand-binding domain-containing protein [Xanthomonadales bacterium]
MSTIYSEQLFSRNAAIFRPFLARAGLSENILEQPDIEVPIEAYIDLLEMVARESEPSIGLIMGETTQAGDLGDYGLAMAATPNAGECLRIMAQYLYVFAQMNTIRVDQASDWTVVSYRYHGPEPFGAIHDTEFAIVAILTILRGLTGQHIVPRYAEFA